MQDQYHPDPHSDDTNELDAVIHHQPLAEVVEAAHGGEAEEELDGRYACGS